MKKPFTRMFMLSCLMAVTVNMSPAQADDADEAVEKANIASMASIGAANASAAYTGNTAMAAQAAQPGQVMMPPGMQYGQPMYMVPGTMIPGMGTGKEEEEQRPVTMRYNKNEVEGGFYGAALPVRLFNNVPSDW